MRLAKILERYSSDYVVIQPIMRNVEDNKPVSFKVLKECFSEWYAKEALRFYIREGYEGVFILPCSDKEGNLSPENAARMFRILYGREG